MKADLLFSLRLAQIAAERAWLSFGSDVPFRQAALLFAVAGEERIRLQQLVVESGERRDLRLYMALRRMAEDGLLRREQSPRGQVRYEITPKGRGLLETVRAEMQTVAAYLWGDADPVQIEVFDALLRQAVERTR